MTTVAQLLQQAGNRLPDSDSPRLDAELLLCKTLDVSRTWLIAHAEDRLNDRDQVRFDDLIRQRQRGRPIAHLLGLREFWSLPLKVTTDTLIPRPETEHLVAAALEQIPTHSSSEVVDLGTGSGAIALAIAGERPQARVTATDRSKAALAVASDNAETLGFTNLRLLESDWFSALAEARFDLVVSNPPYIASGDPHLKQGDVAHEPRSALIAGDDGLSDIRLLCAAAPLHLKAGGWLMLEHGFDQGDAVRALLQQNGFAGVETRQDFAGQDRITLGQLQ